MVKVSVKWNKEKFDIDVDPSQPVSVFKSQLYSLSLVPLERQKIMGFKGGILKDNADWKDLDLTEGKALMMVGSADEVKKVEVQTKFIEDLPPQLAENLHVNLPPGLMNLGNTCYLNATLQTMKSCPELVNLIKRYKPASVSNPTYSSLVKASQSVFNDLSKKSLVPVSTYAFLNVFRRLFPQFDEQKNGVHMQQDADEAWSQLLTAYANEFPIEGEKINNPTESLTKSQIGKLFGIGVTEKYSCKENSSEEATTRQETLWKLACNISNDTSYLFEGIKKGLEEEISKKSPTLNKEAIYTKQTTITRLPPYLVAQFVRFHWKQGVKIANDAAGVSGVKTKIIRAVQFPFTLDVYDFCTPELKAKLQVGRKALDDEFNQSLERKRKAAEDLVNLGTANVKKMVTDNSSTTTTTTTTTVTTDNISKLEENNTGKYELKAVLTHQGLYADSGHYIAWVKQAENKWLKFDDDQVTECTNEEITKLAGGGQWHTAYLTLYASIMAPTTTATTDTDVKITDVTTTTTTTTNQ